MAQNTKKVLDTRNLVTPEELSSMIKLQLNAIWKDQEN